MRTIDEIKKEMTDAYTRNEMVRAAYGIGEGETLTLAKASVEGVLLYVVAFAVWTLERLFGEHEKEVKEYIVEMKPHTLRWYANMAKAFRLGCSLTDEGEWAEPLTDEEIAAAQIVKHANCSEHQDTDGAEPVLYLKVARGEGDDRRPLAADEIAAFKAYVGRMKDAGIRLTVVNREGDEIRLQMTVYVNPMVIDANGMSLVTAEYPVKNAVKDYLLNIPFDSEFRCDELVDAVQAVEGVVQPVLEHCAVNGTTLDAPFHTPAAGYYGIDDDNITIHYESYESARN